MSSDGEAEKFLLDAGLPTRTSTSSSSRLSPRTASAREADMLVIAEGRFQPEKSTGAVCAAR
jgi:hypothetical protein